MPILKYSPGHDNSNGDVFHKKLIMFVFAYICAFHGIKEHPQQGGKPGSLGGNPTVLPDMGL